MTEIPSPDIALRVMVGGDNSLIGLLFRSMLRCGALDGKFIIATDDIGRIVGVSVWFGPGCSLFASSVNAMLCWIEIFSLI